MTDTPEDAQPSQTAIEIAAKIIANKAMRLQARDKNLRWPALPPMTLCGGPLGPGYNAVPASLDWAPSELDEKGQQPL